MEDENKLSLKEHVTELVNWLENSNSNIDKFEILDTSIEDWAEIFSKSSKVFGILAKSYNISQELFFKRFLKGLSTQINSTKSIDYESKKKLADYLSKNKNIEYIYTTIRKSLTANSLNCTELLAIILGEILQKQLEMTPENITIIDALHTINDYDLNNFYKIYTAMQQESLRNIRLDKLYQIFTKESIQISINKLVNLQIIFQDTITIHQGLRFGGDEDDPLNTIMNDDEKFLILYDVSDKLFNLLEKNKGQILFEG